MKAYARRDGNVATVFVDVAGNPMHIQAYDQEPAGFPRSMPVHMLEQNFPQYEFIFVTPPESIQPEGQEIPDEMIAKFMKDVNARPELPRTLQVAPVSGLEDRLFKEFSSMLVSLKSLKGKEAKEMKRDIEAVGSFLLALDAAYEEKLKELSIVEEPKKRFTL